jgi:hypothetical protein
MTITPIVFSFNQDTQTIYDGVEFGSSGQAYHYLFLRLLKDLSFEAQKAVIFTSQMYKKDDIF